jgi:hypothetical protein
MASLSERTRVPNRWPLTDMRAAYVITDDCM